MTNLSAAIQDIVAERGGQNALSRETGVSQKTLSRYCRGVSVPSSDILETLFAAISPARRREIADAMVRDILPEEFWEEYRSTAADPAETWVPLTPDELYALQTLASRASENEDIRRLLTVVADLRAHMDADSECDACKFFGAKLSEVIRAHGGQSRFSEESGVGQGSLSNFAAGMHWPRSGNLEKILRAVSPPQRRVLCDAWLRDKIAPEYHEEILGARSEAIQYAWKPGSPAEERVKIEKMLGGAFSSRRLKRALLECCA